MRKSKLMSGMVRRSSICARSSAGDWAPKAPRARHDIRKAKRIFMSYSYLDLSSSAMTRREDRAAGTRAPAAAARRTHRAFWTKVESSGRKDG